MLSGSENVPENIVENNELCYFSIYGSAITTGIKMISQQILVSFGTLIAWMK